MKQYEEPYIVLTDTNDPEFLRLLYEFYQESKKDNRARAQGVVGPFDGLEKVVDVALMFKDEHAIATAVLMKHSESVGEVGKVMVQKNERRKGYGGQLEHILKQRATELGMTHIIANVFQTNTESQGLFLNTLGYQKYYDFTPLSEEYQQVYPNAKYLGDIYDNFAEEIITCLTDDGFIQLANYDKIEQEVII
ncbi:MAG: GNAT family N-acetyltransferase [Firmicutes bacterium]|nr:GNAT family N-acetyltransferase [Bacillota bacterium]